MIPPSPEHAPGSKQRDTKQDRALYPERRPDQRAIWDVLATRPPTAPGQRPMLQRAATDDAPRIAPGIVDEELRSAGRPLEPDVREFFEPRLGQDLSDVRVHDGARAAQSASAVNALAYTVGRDVVFGDRGYRPATQAGRRLLAHELAHVAQQRSDGHGAAGALPVAPGAGPHERAADAAASAMFTDRPVLPQPHARVVVQRDPPKGSPAPKGPLPAEQPLSPAEMFELATRDRSWEFNPGGAPKQDPDERGRGVGPAAGGRRAGNSVFSVIQITDADGKLVDRSAGRHVVYGDAHAEQAAMRALEGRVSSKAHGGKMIVLVDQEPCGPGSANCGGGLREFAKKHGLALEVYVPTRQQQKPGQKPVPAGDPPPEGKPGTEVRPRTAAAGSQRRDMPAVTLKRLSHLELTGPATPSTSSGTAPATTPATGGGTAPKTTPAAPRTKGDFRVGGNTKRPSQGGSRPATIGPTGRRSAPHFSPKGAGLGEIVGSGSRWLSDVAIRHQIATTILGRWPEIERLRTAHPTHVIVGELWGYEANVADSVGNVVRGITDLYIDHGPTEEDAMASITRAKAMPAPPSSGFHVVGPQYAVIEPEQDLDELKEKVDAEDPCFIATACYGSAMAPEVDTLRHFRDERLLPTRAGRAFTRTYYRLAPGPARFIERHELLRSVVREALVRPLVRAVGRWPSADHATGGG
jgi:hypothetical protein